MKINSSTEAICLTQVANTRDDQLKQRLARKYHAAIAARFLRIASAVVILLLACISGYAQTTAGTIVGNLTDPTGAVLAATQVTLVNIGNDDTRQTVTNQSGFYQFVNVPPGSYRISVQKQGFTNLVREPINLQVESTVQIDLQMQLGSENQQVVVTAATPLIHADTISLGAVVDERETEEMPLNGRNPMNLTALVPSVIPQGSSMASPTAFSPSSWGDYQIGGGFGGESLTYLDGSPLNNAYLNETAMIPTQDSLEEFKVGTNNLSAEYGRLAGGVINFRTKSGTNDLHGSAWEFIRNKVLNANTYFANLAGLQRPPFTQNQYGLDIGGPLTIPHLYNGKNKTFVFMSFEGYGLRQGITYTETVPTTAEIGGDLSGLGVAIYDPLTTCGVAGGPVCGSGVPQYNRTQFANANISSRLNPTAVAYLHAYYPAPNTAGNNGNENYIANVSAGGNNYQYVVHLDQNVSDKQHVSSRYTYWDNNEKPTDPLKTGICQVLCGELFKVHNFVLDDTYTFNSTTILDLGVSYQRFWAHRGPVVSFSAASIGWPSSLQSQIEFPGPPAMVISGFDIANTFGSSGGDAEIKDASDDDRIAGNITKFLGNHTLKFGGEFWRETFNHVQTTSSSGTFSFNNSFTSQNPLTAVGGAGLASFLLGYATSGSASYANPVAAEQLYPGLYADDKWRATRALTIDLGVRWENNFPWTERHNLLSYFSPTTPNPLLVAASAGNYPGAMELVDSSARGSRSNINTKNNQFSPRVGIAYAILAKTIVSAGYGIFWLPTDISFSNAPSGDPINTFATTYVASINGGLTPASTISNPFPSGIQTPPGRNANYQSILLGTAVAPQVVSNPYFAYAQQWNAAVQEQIGNSASYTVAYAGAKGTHLPFYSLQIDQLPDNDLALGSALVQQVANPFYGVINSSYSLGASTIPYGQLLRPYPAYNGVQVPEMGMGASTYNSLQITAQKRFSQLGSSISGAFTWAKLLSNTDTQTSFAEVSGTAGIQDSNNLRGEKSLSSDDVRKRLVVSYIYDIPIGRGKHLLSGASKGADYVIGGWGLEGITTLMSGWPLFLTTNSNLTNSFGGGSRPNYTQGCQKNISGAASKKLHEWFNTSCFTQPSAYTFGNESRTDSQLRAPGIANWDSSLFKNFPIRKEATIQFRAEAFNLFNRVQFGYPGQVEGQASFGVISSQVNSPRLIQFALRINY